MENTIENITEEEFKKLKEEGKRIYFNLKFRVIKEQDKIIYSTQTEYKKYNDKYG